MIECTYRFGFADRARVFTKCMRAFVDLPTSIVKGVSVLDATTVTLAVQTDSAEAEAALDSIAETYEGRRI